MKTRKNGVNLVSAALPHMSSFKEESDEFYFSDIYTRVRFEGSQNPKKILKNYSRKPPLRNDCLYEQGKNKGYSLIAFVPKWRSANLRNCCQS